MMKKIALALLLMIVPAASADSVRERLSATVRAQYGQRMPYGIIVPYKKVYFATAYNVDSETRNSTGKKTHFAVYEYVGSRWKFIFEFDAGVDADEESARLDALFSKYQFSSEMRGKLMYGDELRL
ncbi:hypothetical protein IV102_35205 [bacterium]|nr:hypothetical protein [bacterium]